MKRLTEWAGEGGWSWWLMLAAAFMVAFAWVGFLFAEPSIPDPFEPSPSTVVPMTIAPPVVVELPVTEGDE